MPENPIYTTVQKEMIGN